MIDTSDAVINVVIRGRPEGVVGVRIECVVQEIIIRIGPKQRSKPTTMIGRKRWCCREENCVKRPRKITCARAGRFAKNEFRKI